MERAHQWHLCGLYQRQFVHCAQRHGLRFSPLLPAQFTSRFPNHHGAPIHIGDPEGIGITSLSKAEWVQGPGLLTGEVAVFWACGVTPQVVPQASKPELMITHYPAHMFISDIPAEQQALL